MNVFPVANRKSLRTLRWLASAAFALLVVLVPSHRPAASRPASEAIPAYADTLDLATIYGKIQFVEHFPDYKVKVVEHFPDLKVQIVEHFPDGPGKWQIVEHFPDYKIQIVEHFPDFKIQYVDHFPGVE